MFHALIKYTHVDSQLNPDFKLSTDQEVWV
jgi:hypothetical protein